MSNPYDEYGTDQEVIDSFVDLPIEVAEYYRKMKWHQAEYFPPEGKQGFHFHEACELCSFSICHDCEPIHWFGYRSEKNAWLCERCYSLVIPVESVKCSDGTVVKLP